MFSRAYRGVRGVLRHPDQPLRVNFALDIDAEPSGDEEHLSENVGYLGSERCFQLRLVGALIARLAGSTEERLRELADFLVELQDEPLVRPVDPAAGGVTD